MESMTRSLGYILIVTVVAAFFTHLIVSKALNAYDDANDVLASYGKNL